MTPKIMKLPYSQKNAGESEKDYSPIWGNSYEAYKAYQSHGDPDRWENPDEIENV